MSRADATTPVRAREHYSNPMRVHLCEFENQSGFFFSVHERVLVPVVFLLIFAMHADVCDPDHTWKVFQDFVHSGLEYVL